MARRQTYNGPIHSNESSSSGEDNIFVGGKPREVVNGQRKKQYGDIKYWLADAQRREAKRVSLGGRLSSERSRMAQLRSNDNKTKSNFQHRSDDTTTTTTLNPNLRSTTTPRLVLSHVEIIMPARTRRKPVGRLVEQPVVPPAHSSPASSDEPRRSGRTRKKVVYAEPDPDQLEPSDNDSAYTSDPASGAGPSTASDPESIDNMLEESASLDSEPEVSVEQPPAKRRKKVSVSKASATKVSAESSDTESEGERPKARDTMENVIISGNKGLDQDKPPLADIADIFLDITTKACSTADPSAPSTKRPILQDVIARMKQLGRSLRVATMCSGTESPLLALELIRDALKKLGVDDLPIEHVFSAEIEPFKQAYIERNFQPPIIFRDITEITHAHAQGAAAVATTAYGAKVAIPQNIDLLIAGTACVDFSNLNNKKKGLNDNGESADTFKAMLEYADKYRPTIIVLENIQNAPWDKMNRKCRKIGYEPTGVVADTKDYYLPQTRCRGYMVCFDTRGQVQVADTIRSDFKSMMEGFRRRASSPVSSFLLPSDDASIIRMRNVLARQSQLDDALKSVDWAKCEIRHVDYRQQKQLGNARPLTDWQECGTLVVPEYFDKSWFKKQGQRVWDLLDLLALGAALPENGSCDLEYKTRVCDVSQNIDRSVDRTQAGISPCLTPSGIFYITDRGGPLAYAESLALQGLPLDKISFTTETERNIQDLAGNAMSSTVVGSAILSSLLLGYKILPERVACTARNDATPEPKMLLAGVEKLESSTTTDKPHDDLDLHSLLTDAAQSVKKCVCEGRVNIAERSIRTCKECNHTSCIDCGGKPEHVYSEPEQTKRDRPEDFIQKWRPQIPRKIQFVSKEHLQEFLNSQILGQTSVPKEKYLEAISNAVKHPLTFKEMRRMSTWIITYESPFAKLDLVLDSEFCQWKLFAKPDASLSTNDALREFLQRPIARTRASEESLYENTWEWKVPVSTSDQLLITGSGDQVPSWASRLGLLQLSGEKVWSELKIKTNQNDKLIDGTYKYLPKCGTACATLYKRVLAPGEPHMYLFLDPIRVGEVENDSCVFASDHSRMEYDQTREIVCSIDPKWRPWKLNASFFSKVNASSDHAWVQDDSCSIEPTSVALRFATNYDDLLHVDCSLAKAIASVEFEVLSDVGRRFEGMNYIQPDDKEFFSTFGYAFEPLRQTSAPKSNHIQAGHIEEDCHTCAPSLPEVRWNIILDSKGKVQFRPYEDPESANNYEIALKSRPQPFVVESTITDTKVKVRIGVNIQSLCQRAVRKLSKLTKELGSISYALETNWVDKAAFIPPAFTLRDNCNDNIFSPKGLLKIDDLFEKQKRSLSWMKKQEKGQAFVLRETEEALMPHLGYRLQAQASATITVRGGIRADHAGFGKTVVSLALIHSEFVDFKREQITANMKDLVPDTPSKNSDEQILPEKLAATLIIVPPHLVEQWVGEVKDILGDSYNTVKISKLADLNGSLEKFRKADIIILNHRVLTDERHGYHDRLALFGAVPICTSRGAREFSSWLDRAAKDVPKHLKVLKDRGLNDLKSELEQANHAHLNDDTLQAFEEASKRLKGANYIPSESRAAPSVQDDKRKKNIPKKSAPALDLNMIDKIVLLEMFHFNRLIVDEFSYAESNELELYSRIKADKRWGLSATPHLRDPYDVSRMSRLLGVSLPIGASAPGLLSKSNSALISQNMTNLERFESFKDPPSRAVQEQVHGLAQEFLDSFVRQNILTFEYPFTDQIVPVKLNTDHRLSYASVSQFLTSQDMRLNSTEKAKKTRSGDPSVSSAEELLVKTAAVFDSTKRPLELYSKTCDSSDASGVSEDSPGLDAESNSGDASQNDSGPATKKNTKSTVMKRTTRGNAKDTVTKTVKTTKKNVKNTVMKTGKTIETSLIAYLNGCIQDRDEAKSSLFDLLKQALESATVLNSQGLPRAECPLYSWAFHLMRNESPEDQSIVSEVGDIIQWQDMETQVTSAGTNKRKRADFKESKDLKDAVSKLNDKVKKYLVAMRGVRVCENALRHENRQNTGVELHCQNCHKHNPEDLYLSALCGHITCGQCYVLSKLRGGVCGDEGCGASLKSFNLLHFSKLGGAGTSPYGKKVDEVVSLLHQIVANEEKAILFVQYTSHVEQLAAILHNEGITCLYNATAKAKGDSAYINRFRDPVKYRGKDESVLILRTGAEEAAGANLTRANHVIFFAPLLSNSQYHYNAQMAQAVGRVRRPPQEKHVQVYRITALDTIDVDILEHREHRNTILDSRDIFNTGVNHANRMDIDSGAQFVDLRYVSEPDKPERAQLIHDPLDNKIKLVPKSMLLQQGQGIEGKSRVMGYDDFSSLIKFSRAFADDDG